MKRSEIWITIHNGHTEDLQRAQHLFNIHIFSAGLVKINYKRRGGETNYPLYRHMSLKIFGRQNILCPSPYANVFREILCLFWKSGPLWCVSIFSPAYDNCDIDSMVMWSSSSVDDSHCCHHGDNVGIAPALVIIQWTPGAINPTSTPDTGRIGLSPLHATAAQTIQQRAECSQWCNQNKQFKYANLWISCSVM